jgi:hypothetical protein
VRKESLVGLTTELVRDSSLLELEEGHAWVWATGVLIHLFAMHERMRSGECRCAAKDTSQHPRK